MSDQSSRSRRAFLGGVGRSAAAVLGGGILAKVATSHADPTTPTPMIARDGAATTATGATCAVHDDLPADADATVLAFVAPVAPGTALGAWSVARVHAVFRGAVPFVLAHPDGRRAQVDLMAFDRESPPGVAATRAGQLYLVNSGRGAAFTPPDLEAAIRTLAGLLARDGAGLGLLSFAERHRCHPGGVFVVPA